MGEQKLPLLPVNCLSLPVLDPQLHIAQRQALHPAAAGIIRLEGHQRATHGGHSMPRRLRQPVAVPGGAGARVGGSPGGQNDRGPRQRPVLRGLHTNNGSILCLKSGHPISEQFYPLAAQLKKQGVNDVRRLVGAWKHTVASLCFQRDTKLLEESHGICGRKAADRAVKEFSVTGYGGQELLTPTGIGHIAAALPGDVELAPHLLVGLHQQHCAAGPGRCDGCHHSRGAGSHHNNSVICSMLHQNAPHNSSDSQEAGNPN